MNIVRAVKLVLLNLLAGITCFSQMQIKGTVVNVNTGATIPSASVFISNTSKGTTSDSNGYFVLNNVPEGKQNLVISCIGYETNVYSFNSNQLPLLLKIEMSLKVKELEAVVVEPSEEGTWQKWGETFLKNFVGTSANASRCRILNEKAIRFRFYKRSNRLIAYADEPLLLENSALGYRVSYQLENFELNFKNRTVFFQGYSLFTSMEKEGKEKDRWRKNRNEAYAGSIMHFLRSVYQYRINEEGFEVRRMTKRLDAQKNEIIEHGAHLLTADSLITRKENGLKTIYFPDYIYVTYKNEREEEGYVATQNPPRSPTWQRSYVTLVGGRSVVIDMAGNYSDPQDFLTSAYWGWSEKLANTLPLDYIPKSN